MNYPAQLKDTIEGYSNWFEVIKTFATCERILAQRCEKLGLTLAQHDVLVALLYEDQLRPSALAKRLFVAKSNVAGLLSRLARDGLIELVPDPDDGRAKIAMLSPRGRTAVQQTLAAQAELARGMIAQLTPAECDQMGDSMRRIRKHLLAVEERDREA